MVPPPPGNPSWEEHLNVAFEFRAPTNQNGNRYPQRFWMSRARRLWEEFGNNDLANRNVIAELISRADAQVLVLQQEMILLGDEADDDLAVEERHCIDAISEHQRMISIYEEWRHASLHCTTYPEESAAWLRSEIANCHEALNDSIYPRYRDVLRLVGPLERPGGPEPQPKMPGFLQRIQEAVVDSLFRKRRDRALRVLPPELPAGFWLGGWILGRGGQGFVNLWVQLDDNDRISDRRAVKDTYVRPYDWDKLSFWYGDVRNIQDRVPMEVAAMLALQKFAHCDQIVTMDTWIPHWENMMYRTYMGYHAYRDLQRVIDGYRNSQGANASYVPEAFVWRVFEACVEAGLAMESGAPAWNGGIWTPIVHRDLKPNNVFLDEDRSDDWASYPAPKIGDFGLAIYTAGADDPFNPDAYTGPGTLGYIAPEQTQLVDPDSLDLVAQGERFLLTSKTNVWATGKVIMQMMGIDAARGIQPEYTLTDREPEFFDAALWYSKKLRRMVKACVRYEPNRRPTFSQLLQRIRHYTAYNDNGEDAMGGNDQDQDQGSVDWGDSSDSEDDDNPDDLADGMRAFDPDGDEEDPHPLSHFSTRLGRSFPIDQTIVAGGGGLPVPGMGFV